MNNNMIKLICLVLSVATACLSATLTTKFMFGFGNDMGTPILMAVLGLLLDLAKCATPLFIFMLWAKRNYLSTLFAILLSVTLSVVSFFASVAALETGVTASKQNSVSYQKIESQITDYRDQVIELRQLAKRQQDAKQITKSQHTLSQIPTLLFRIDELSNQQATFSGSESVVSKYGMMISYVTAAALELLSWLFVCVTNALYPQYQRTQTQYRAVDRSQSVMTSPVFDNDSIAVNNTSQTNAVLTQLNAMNDACLTAQCDECDDECELRIAMGQNIAPCHAQIYLDIKNAVLAKTVKPSQRGINESFRGVGRDLMNQVLEELKGVGFLKSYRKGYAYA